MFSKTVHLKIMVIGATGAGKSSLINLFYVWSLGIQATELGKLKKALIRTSHLDGDG
jgi:predicted GTPase